MPSAKKTKPLKVKSKQKVSGRTRVTRPYPASSFTDALPLGEAIMKYGAGEKVRRLTLLEKMNKSPTSGATKMMITNSGKYGITKGSYSAEHLELTEKGRIVVDSTKSEREQKRAAFDLAVEGLTPFKLLYDQYKDKRLPEREVMKDVLRESGTDATDLDECVDTFTVNVKDLNLLRTIGGAETLVSIEQILEAHPSSRKSQDGPDSGISTSATSVATGDETPHDWDKICFYITPIGVEGTEERKHSDLFMSSLIQPALEEIDLKVVRADHIGEPGMITTQL